jgi:hypothetical protein
MCMWNAWLTRCLGGEITLSRDHNIRTWHGHGVAYRTPIMSMVASQLISVNDLAHTLST